MVECYVLFFICVVECSKYIYIPFLGPDLGLDLVRGLGPADAAIARAHAAAATAGTYVGNSVLSVVGRMQSSSI